MGQIDIGGSNITIKDISVIPRGDYCYKILSINNDGMRLKKCPYWERRDEDFYCNYLEEEDWMLEDSLKVCGVNNEEV